MKLKEIIEDTDLLVPNSFSLEQKVKWANQTQRQLYRDFPVWNKAYSFPVTAGKDKYSIPLDCQQDRIMGVTIDEYSFHYVSPEETWNKYGIYTIQSEKLVFVPAPNKNGTGILYYQPSPQDLTVNELEAVPNFPEDYHELLSLGIAYRVAQRNQDFKLAAELEGRYKYLASEARFTLTRPKPKRTRIVRSWT